MKIENSESRGRNWKIALRNLEKTNCIKQSGKKKQNKIILTTNKNSLTETIKNKMEALKIN